MTEPVVDSRDVTVGEPFVVTLSAASGTGYAWTVASGAPDVETLDTATVADSPGIPGAPQRTEITLVARAPGRHEVVLRLQRPWEQESAEERRIVVDAT